MSALREIQQVLRRSATGQGKAAAAKFVPGSVNVYGVRMPVMNELAKKYRHGGHNLSLSLWKSGSFEEKVLAAKILGWSAKKDPLLTLVLIRRFSKDISNWAVCDTLGMQSPKALVKTHSTEIFTLSNELIRSKNLWQRRLALVLAEWYTRIPAFHTRIRALLSKVKKDEAYYVKKAVVWIERNLKKKR